MSSYQNSEFTRITRYSGGEVSINSATATVSRLTQLLSKRAPGLVHVVTANMKISRSLTRREHLAENVRILLA